MNRLICGLRSLWYGLSEPPLLRWHRRSAAKGGFVTVYIPTHNRADLLMSRALPSVLAQDYPSFEVIVAAHGCTDGTVMRVRLWSDPRLRVINVPREKTYPPTAENHWLAGPVAPANAALKAARGDWIARIDDDDTWTPDHLSRLMRHALCGGYEFVSSAYECERDGRREVVDHDGGTPPIGGTQTWLYRGYLRFMKYNPDCWRKRWNRVNDTDLADRFRKAGVRIGWHEGVTAYVLPRPGETTVGLDAYRRSAGEIERHFGFKGTST